MGSGARSQGAWSASFALGATPALRQDPPEAKPVATTVTVNGIRRVQDARYIVVVFARQAGSPRIHGQSGGNTMADSNRDAAPEAIEAVALAGLSRSRLQVWTMVRIALPAILGVCTLVFGALWYTNSAEVARLKGRYEPERKLVALKTDWPVAVLLPIDAGRADTPTDKIDAYLNGLSAADSIKAGAIVANAKRLWQGFSDAFNARQVKPVDQHHYYFAYPFKDDTTDKIMAQFETWYETVGVRTFVITISGAVVRIKEKFATWARTKPANDQPVMVATVASAPNIADRENGIYRYYIRSTEESTVLANYIKSLNTTEVGVFFVDDEYGRRAKDILLSLLGDGTVIRPFLIGISDEEASIRTSVPAFIGRLTSGANAVAVIIGYGSMMKAMVENLEQPATGAAFRGKILSASTFTEESWRPSLDGVIDRIRTVGPGALDLNRSKRGVVYQFSYLTLMRALNCRNARGREALWECWSGPSEVETDWARVEFTTDGDSVVTSLRLLKVAEN